MIGEITIEASPVLAYESYLTSFGRRDARRGGDGFAGYRHIIRAGGGFWSMQARLFAPLPILTELFFRGLVRHVEAYGEQGIMVWEGFINGMELDFFGQKLAIDIDRAGNRVWVRYGTGTRSTVYNDAAAQAAYGIKEFVLSGGDVGAALANQIAQVWLQFNSDPTTPDLDLSLSFAESDEEDALPSLLVKCLGYFHTLYWRTHNQTALAGNEAISTQIASILTARAQFLSSWNVAQNAQLVNRQHDADRSAGDLLMSLAAAGDTALRRMVIGVYERRQLIYEPAAAYKLFGV